MASKVLLAALGLFLVVVVESSTVYRERHHKPLKLCAALGESSEEACEKSMENGLLRKDEEDLQEPMYLLYHDATNPSTYKALYKSDIRYVTQAKPHPNAQWKVLIHGFTNDRNARFPQNVKNAYLERTNKTGVLYNVLIVDWGASACANINNAKDYLYNYASKNVGKIGEKIGDFLLFLHENKIFDISKDVHVIGHSLGAHVSGHVGKQVLSKLGMEHRLNRISGLDPAGPKFWETMHIPTFTELNPLRRLHKRDANFVDVYHTSLFYGSKEPFGNVDFFVYDGMRQPSCLSRAWWVNWVPTVLRTNVNQICSHNYATILFAQYVNDNSLAGCECTSYAAYTSGRCDCKSKNTFGEFVDSRLSGQFFVQPPLDYDLLKKMGYEGASGFVKGNLDSSIICENLLQSVSKVRLG